MKQYLELLQTIKDRGTHKPPAREGMPGSTSLFGYQFRHNLQEGFPLLTTKKMFWKGVVVELLWFLRGDTNIKYLVDNGVNIWNEDAFQYYIKQVDQKPDNTPGCGLSFSEFVKTILTCEPLDLQNWFEDGSNYVLGDCGYQYGRVWRNWMRTDYWMNGSRPMPINTHIDQISQLILDLRNNPESRRHIVTAIDPAHDTDLALYWCHAMFQFNCRPIANIDRKVMLCERPEWKDHFNMVDEDPSGDIIETIDEIGIPKYYLDCQLYQRSADVFLGVPFNIASYALLTHIIAKMCNMIPGEFIHTFGDVHIYDNHMDAVNEQLTREPGQLPTLLVGTHSLIGDDIYNDIDTFAQKAYPDMFVVTDYHPQSTIKAQLSTGLKK